MNDFIDFCNAWHIDAEQVRLLEPIWNRHISDWAKGLPYFLSVEYLEEVYPLAKAPFSLAEVRPYAQEIARLARENTAISLLAWVIYQCAYLENPAVLLKLPKGALPYLGEKYSGFFYFMVSLGAFPLIKERFRLMAIPEQYAVDLMAWFGGTMIAYARAHNGTPGRPGSFAWIRKYIDGILFRVGRLEYLLHTCPDWAPLIFQDAEGRIVVLCRDDWRLDKQCGRVDEPAAAEHITTFSESEQGWRGYAVAPDGAVDFSQEVTLLKSQWRPAASAQDLCPSIHIPAGSHLPFSEVKASLLAARDFFERYFHCRVPFFCCNSWILNPAWEKLLPASNIATFRRQGYAFPAPDWGELGGTGFIFGRDDLRPEEMTAQNTMERAMQAASLKKENRAGAIFMMASDLEKLGREYYRNTYGKPKLE